MFCHCDPDEGGGSNFTHPPLPSAIAEQASANAESPRSLSRKAGLRSPGRGFKLNVPCGCCTTKIAILQMY